MNVSERYDRDLGPPQHVLDATQGLLEHRLANKLWSSADDDRRRADVLVDGSYGRAAGVARIGLWRSHQAFYGTFYGVFYGNPAPNSCLAQKNVPIQPWLTRLSLLALGSLEITKIRSCETHEARMSLIL